MKIVCGFTLIELVITLVVAAILLTVGIPSFEDFIKTNNIRANANTFLTDLHLARSEAVKRNGPVRICKSADSFSCTTNGGWEQGWIVFSDINKNKIVDNNEPTIRSNGPTKGYIAIRGNQKVQDSILFESSGISTSTYGSIVICDNRISNLASAPDDIKPKIRVITISSAGRMRIIKGTDDDVSDSILSVSCLPL